MPRNRLRLAKLGATNGLDKLDATDGLGLTKLGAHHVLATA